jgi:hypothetical protein
VAVGTALRCSSAVPALRRPVRVGGAAVDVAGAASATHLDVAAEAWPRTTRPRLALISSPLSRFLPMRLLLRAELRHLRARGVRAVVFEPSGELPAVMGWNPMDGRVAARVAEAAHHVTLRRLAAGGGRLADLLARSAVAGEERGDGGGDFADGAEGAAQPADPIDDEGDGMRRLALDPEALE